MNTQAFGYQPLTSPEAIRLLLLEPARDQTAALHGKLLHTTLADCDYELIEPYIALSYVWGDPTQTGIIHIAGRAATITATLASALRALRDETRQCRIWADALCIDQSNIPERNNQVTLMGLIYSVAAHTVIYLGPSTKEADMVLGSAPHTTWGIYPQRDQTERDAVIQAANLHVLNRPWFSRVWVFQELILSRDPWVQCGRRRTRWNNFCSLLLHGGPASVPKTNANEGLQMLNTMNRFRGGSSAGKMLFLLQARRGLGATDARDFVFAHMGIASDRQRVADAVPVDYSSSLAQVFARMAMYIVESESVETLISVLDEQAEVAQSPDMLSWAVDWRRRPSACPPMYANNFLTRAKSIMAPAVCLEQDKILSLVGHSVGVIESVSITLPISSTLNLAGLTRYQDIVSKIDALYSSKGGIYYTGDSAGQHPRVSIRGREAEHKELCEALFSEWITFLQTLKPSPTDAPDEHISLLRCFRTWAEEQTGKPRIFVTRESADLLRIMWAYLHPGVTTSSLDGRRLGATFGGDVGVVPAQAQKGDHVVNVMGSRVSLVLRPVDVSDKDSTRTEHELRNRLRSLSSRLATDDTADDGKPRFMEDVPMNVDTCPIEHYVIIGSSSFDGKVPWAVGQLPGDESKMRIYALH